MSAEKGIETRKVESGLDWGDKIYLVHQGDDVWLSQKNRDIDGDLKNNDILIAPDRIDDLIIELEWMRDYVREVPS